MNKERAVYHEIEHTADLGFEVSAHDLPSLFSAAGEALYSLIADPRSLELREEIPIAASGEAPEELLHAWLCELLALFNVNSFLGKQCEISRLAEGSVEGRIKGEKLDLSRHTFNTEIKGVTYHDFKVWRDGDRWHARVILDV